MFRDTKIGINQYFYSQKVFANTNFSLFQVFGDTFCLFRPKIAEESPKMNQKKYFEKRDSIFIAFCNIMIDS